MLLPDFSEIYSEYNMVQRSPLGSQWNGNSSSKLELNAKQRQDTRKEYVDERQNGRKYQDTFIVYPMSYIAAEYYVTRMMRDPYEVNMNCNPYECPEPTSISEPHTYDNQRNSVSLSTDNLYPAPYRDPLYTYT